MPLAPLIDKPRAQQNSTLSTLGASNPTYLSSLLDSASDVIRRVCHRDFTSATYTHYFSGSNAMLHEPLKLLEYPVLSVNRVAVANRCLQVLNSGATVQRATVQTNSSGDFTLTTVASAVSNPQVLLAATYPTVLLMANAITALGNGWSTAILSGSSGSYNNFPVTDLRPLQGAYSALIGGCWLDIFEDWTGSASSAWPSTVYGASTPLWRLDADAGFLYGRFPRGQQNLMVNYTAGYVTVPGAVQEACVQLAQSLYNQSVVNGVLRSERLGPAAYTFRDVIDLPGSVRALLSTYVAHSNVANSYQ